MPMIKIANASKQFGKTLAINNLFLQIEKGEFVGILGPSGCGKTTLLRLIAGLETPSAGTIEINGELANNPKLLIPAQKRQVGMVFQDLALWPHLNAVAHLDFVLRSQLQVKSEKPACAGRLKAYPVTKFFGVKSLNEKIEEIFTIAAFPLELREKYPHQLSGGEKQRLAIARALAQNPKILLLDEPFANLDTMLKKDLQNEIKKLHKNLATTLIYVTHEVQEIKTLTEQLIIMQKGQIVQKGTAKDVYVHPKNEFVSGLIGKKRIEYL